jgi:hypothetical protein
LNCSGVSRAATDWSRFFTDPATTLSSPAIKPLKASLATFPGSSLPASFTGVFCMPARSKNSVSVGPGSNAVTVTPVSFNS